MIRLVVAAVLFVVPLLMGCEGEESGPPSCPEGQAYFYTGCGGTGFELEEGCHQFCRVEDDPTCPTGTSCQPAEIDPCAGQGDECDACSSLILVCLPGVPGADPTFLRSLDESCEGVITGQDVLNQVEDIYVTSFSYQGGDPPPTDLTLTFTFTSGRIRCHPPIPGMDGAPDQDPFIEVEVAFGASTADGVFADEGMATLSAFMPGSTVSIVARLDVAMLAGTFSPMLAADVEDHQVTFTGDAFAASTNGSIFEGGTNPGGVPESRPVGTWAR